MRIGISTASFYPLETELALEIIAKNGVECTEIFYNAQIERKDYFTEKAEEICKKSGTVISALHPMNSFAEPYAIFSEYDRRFYDAIDDFGLYFKTAQRLGAKYINLHGDRPMGNLSVEEYCERFSVLAKNAMEHGVILCQENVNGYRSADPDFLKEMRENLGPLANFTLDIKQCIRAGYTVPEVMDAMGENIRHIHISDHGAGGDCLLPGRGGFDFSSFFKLLKEKDYNGDLIIEVYRNAYNDYSEIFESYNKIKILK